MISPLPPTVIIPGPASGTWLQLLGHRRTLVTTQCSEVCAVLDEAEQSAADGNWVAGFLTYEAAPAFDPALRTREVAGSLPPAWFAVFSQTEPVCLPSPEKQQEEEAWDSDTSFQDYAAAVSAIREAIARGETYQVNFTFPLTCRPRDPLTPWNRFVRLMASQRGRLGAFIETDDFAICSASPELFFELDGDRITCRPMKGTMPRGRWSAEDEARADALRASEKNRAENLMIVDMVRNDLGRIATPGSVETTSLFDIEAYPNVHQMTSTVTAETKAPLVEIARALFPSASVTGAPKIRTCALIRDLEAGPRGVYTGMVGCLGPGRRARFNVAIRTIEVDKHARQSRYGVGSGIVWDSGAAAEFDECKAKASVLTAVPWPDFQLLETLLWDGSNGWKFLESHLARLVSSARYFDMACNGEAIRDALVASVKGHTRPRRVRLLVNREGEWQINADTWSQVALFGARPPAAPPFVRAAVAAGTASSTDVFLFHKTTNRVAYEQARARCPQSEEVLLVNERGELTEGTIGNVVLVFGDEWVTPSIECGLLPGIFRAQLLAEGAIMERPVPWTDIQRADAAYLINSVRGWRRLAVRG